MRKSFFNAICIVAGIYFLSSCRIYAADSVVELMPIELESNSVHYGSDSWLNNETEVDKLVSDEVGSSGDEELIESSENPSLKNSGEDKLENSEEAISIESNSDNDEDVKKDNNKGMTYLENRSEDTVSVKEDVEQQLASDKYSTDEKVLEKKEEVSDTDSIYDERGHENNEKILERKNNLHEEKTCENAELDGESAVNEERSLEKTDINEQSITEIQENQFDLYVMTDPSIQEDLGNSPYESVSVFINGIDICWYSDYSKYVLESAILPLDNIIIKTMKNGETEIVHKPSYYKIGISGTSGKHLDDYERLYWRVANGNPPFDNEKNNNFFQGNIINLKSIDEYIGLRVVFDVGIELDFYKNESGCCLGIQFDEKFFGNQGGESSIQGITSVLEEARGSSSGYGTSYTVITDNDLDSSLDIQAPDETEHSLPDRKDAQDNTYQKVNDSSQIQEVRLPGDYESINVDEVHNYYTRNLGNFANLANIDRKRKGLVDLWIYIVFPLLLLQSDYLA